VATYYKIEAKGLNGSWRMLAQGPHPADLSDDELVDFAREEARTFPIVRSLYSRWRVARMSDATYFERIFEREFPGPETP
jgi:hypothetical protein